MMNEINKICAKCHVGKIENIDNYYFLKNSNKYDKTCRECRKNECIERNIKNKNKINNMTKEEPFEKKCIKCGEVKEVNKNNFHFRKDSNKHINSCKECEILRVKLNYEENRDEKILKSKKRREKLEENNIVREHELTRECKTCLVTKVLNKDNFYHIKYDDRFNLECILCAREKEKPKSEIRRRKKGIPKAKVKLDKNALERQCEECLIIKNLNKDNFHYIKDTNSFRRICKICVNLKQNEKNQSEECRINKNSSAKKYRDENKEKLKNQRKEARKKPKNKIRHSISSSILQTLKRRNKNKNGSISEYLPYSTIELMNHLESKFESWMTWENRGIYNFKTWDDNDSSTWTWQIDHIIPHSEFKYEIMDCEEFKACWDLSNLRPYSAKQNFLDGVKRTRHTKERKNNNKNN
jgi:hypothetical protein